ncbi:hypothetical protein D1816_08020 [Aquimarina sp. AD10]|uniref:tetratricopeptide repeat protein n=1 Tax=Aquimarina sp. AD10 TaxID=1714849 RepID=UPI000E53ADF7|nr:hypothetical protein [Aquimarina sp. AD10]AXT60298.1 hypothetical protein D1816_08020 [Aquimarina sp. AD10]RKN01267.1 hypothetical protein D7033_05460 [Aquimarina sp. AD10]
MKPIYYICIVLLVAITTSCQEPSQVVTNSNDYVKYLSHNNHQNIDETNKKLNFWNTKIKTDSIQLPAMIAVAGVYSEMFQSTGNIQFLKQAEQVLVKSVKVAAIKKEGYLLALARNYISQHRFKEAKNAAQGAYILNPNASAKMVLFDVSMELGQYNEAKKYLEEIADQSKYNFLIRLAKWNDYKGDLDATIRNMEKAKTIAEQSNKKGLMLWSYTNLADYYGHAGRIKDSYDYYLKTLEIDPSNAYAMKGIAWIIYSYEHNPQEALRIIDAVTESYQSPDYFLLKAEIAEFQKDHLTKKGNLIGYKYAIADKRYGKMYNTYNAMLLAEEYQDFNKALEIAEEEIDNRPTPQSYDLKAHILNLKGEHEKALEIAEKFIIGKTFEPETQYHIAEIYKTNGFQNKVNTIKKELIESAYELGPVLSQKIAKL